jgi:hypothetical protein
MSGGRCQAAMTYISSKMSSSYASSAMMEAVGTEDGWNQVESKQQTQTAAGAALRTRRRVPDAQQLGLAMAKACGKVGGLEADGKDGVGGRGCLRRCPVARCDVTGETCVTLPRVWPRNGLVFCTLVLLRRPCVFSVAVTLGCPHSCHQKPTLAVYLSPSIRRGGTSSPRQRPPLADSLVDTRL